MYTYTIESPYDLPKADKAVFIFANTTDLHKLSTNPNITMQLCTFDEDLPVIVVVPSEEFIPLYDRACAPNTYILCLKGSRPSSWQRLWIYLLRTKVYSTALFVEWNILLSNTKTGRLFNMTKNPNYPWEGSPTEPLDFVDWYDNMTQTLHSNSLASVGVDRRHASDVLSWMSVDEEYQYPIQLVMYDFDRLRELKVSTQPALNATNSVIRDTLIDLAIRDAGGLSNTVPQFSINTPSVVYTEEDLHALLQLPKKYPRLFRRMSNERLR